MKLDTDRLKSEMKRRSLNQTGLARAMGLHRATVSAWMQKPQRINLKRLDQLANVLRIDGRKLILTEPQNDNKI